MTTRLIRPLAGGVAAVLLGTAVLLPGQAGRGVTSVHAQDAAPANATAAIRNVAGDVVGLARFTKDGERVRVLVEVQNLPPGFHGLHVHQTGACDAGGATPFASAGGHFAQPADHAHGGQEHGSHAGDLPSLYVLADGSGTVSFLTDRFSVADLLDADGSAIVIHALPDNFANIPTRYVPAPDMATLNTGDAGGRIACGVLE